MFLNISHFFDIFGQKEGKILILELILLFKSKTGNLTWDLIFAYSGQFSAI